MSGAAVGAWRCVAQLGSGSFGIVHVWDNVETGQQIAIKKCRFGPEVKVSQKHLDNWRQEVEILQRLDHPNVVRCSAAPPELLQRLSDDKLPLLCMEYCAGGDLRKILNSSENCCGMKQADILNLVNDMASAVGFLHNRRIIHRDFKPENIVLKQTDERIVYKLIDLGYAKELGQSSLALSFVGTLAYLAPELFLSQEYTKSVDYWSLGFVVHEAITGHRPFLSSLSPAQWMEHVRQKSHREICVWEDPTDGSIAPRERLFPENDLSLSLEADFESWLRLALEWDPSLRGKRDARRDGQVCIFSHLSTMLARTRLRVFSMEKPNYKLDFVIESSSTTVADLLTWMMQSDASRRSVDPLLLLANGTELHPQEALLPALQRVSEKTVYVFSAADESPEADASERMAVRLRAVPLVIPPVVLRCLKNARREAAFPERKQVAAHALYLCSRENRVCKHLAGGLRAYLVHLLARTRDVNLSAQSLNVQGERLSAKFDLFREGLHYDTEKYCDQARRRDHISSSLMFQSWQLSERELEAQMHHVTELIKAANSSLLAVNAEQVAIQRMLKDLAQPRDGAASDLQEYVDKSLRVIEDLRRIPPEGRKELDHMFDTAQVVVKCLKQRDGLLRDYFEQQQRLAAIRTRLEELSGKQLVACEQLEALAIAVSKANRRRQSDMWKLLSAAVQQNKETTQPQPASAGPSSLRSVGSLQFVDAVADMSQDVIRENEELCAQLYHVLQGSSKKSF